MNTTEQTNAEVSLTLDAEQGDEISVFANTTSDPANKILLASYSAPEKNTAKAMILQTNELDIGRYNIEVWSNFSAETRKRHITDYLSIQNSPMI